MKISIEDYGDIVVPPELFKGMTGAFNGQTSYVAKVAARFKKPSYVNHKLPMKLGALGLMDDFMCRHGGYDSYSDPLAGIGLSARILEAHKTTLNDLDEGCAKILDLNFPDAKITRHDILTHHLSSADTIFLDFNDFTFKRGQDIYRGVLENAMESAQKFLIINDCSLFYFRYGPGAFKVYSQMMNAPIASVWDYFDEVGKYYARQGWHLMQANYWPETAFMLLMRDPPRKFYREDTDMRSCLPLPEVRFEE